MARRRPRPGYAFEAPAAASEKPDASGEPAAPPAPPPDACDAPADAFDEPSEADESAEPSPDSASDFEKLADAFEEPGTPPPPRKTAQELAAALEAVSDQLSEPAAPEPKSPRPWSFRRTLHSPSRTPKRFFGSPKPDVEPKTLWEDGDASDAGDAPPRVSLEELDEFVDVVALNKRTGKRSIIRLARGTVMSDVFAAYAQHTKSDAKKLVFVRGDGTEKGKSLSPKQRVADLRTAPKSSTGTPRKRTPRKREPKKSFDEQIWNRAVAIGHDAWDEKHFGSLDAGESVALPLNRAEIRPDVEYMELSIDLGEEEPPLDSASPLRRLRKSASRVTGVTGAFSGKSPPPSPGGERPGTPLRNLRKQASKLSGVTGAFSGKSPE